MLDHATLSASQGSLAHSSSKNRSRDTDKTPIVVSDLSATLDKLHRNSLDMQHTTQDRLEIASSIAMAKMSEAEVFLARKGSYKILFICRSNSVARAKIYFKGKRRSSTVT